MIMRMMAVRLPGETNEAIINLHQKAECLYDMRDYAPALYVYKELLKQDPTDALAHFNIAMMLYNHEVKSLSSELADNHFETAYQLFFASAVNDNNARSQMALGNIFSQKSRMEDKQALDMDDFRYDKNLCAAAYWYARAAEQGVYGASSACAKTLNYFDNSYLDTEPSDAAFIIAWWCENQNPYIPLDPQRAAYWRKLGQSGEYFTFTQYINRFARENE